MSDINKCSSETQSGEIQSKYFVDSRDNTDDSVSEFQEPKKGTKVPKKVQVSAKPKSKATKKPTKKLRGQKDIRTSLKSKKNDLIDYSKDFEAVCKQSGLDVDAEQLQLAIALSKSLQNSDEKAESPENSQPNTSQGRVGKIRRTLQEYGFKVPEVKINIGAVKRGRKRRKESKLLFITEAERQHGIRDKYSQVLLKNIVACKVEEPGILDTYENSLFYLATNISYEDIKNNAVFHIKELLDNTTTTIGSLLRDWSEIPGRPSSPVTKFSKVKLEYMNFTSQEIDSILSGSLAEAQEVVKSKLVKDELDPYVKVSDTDSNHPSKQEIAKELKETGIALEMSQIQGRSYSPDLFDDEFCSIDNTIETTLSQKHLSHNSCSQIDSQKSVPIMASRKTNDLMDLTECVDVCLPFIARINMSVTACLNKFTESAINSQKADLMEITECVSNYSQSKLVTKADKSNTQKDHCKLTGLITDDNIDLTQESSDAEEHTLVNVDDITTHNHIDLTQLDYSNDDTLPLVHISGQTTSFSNEKKNVNIEEQHDLDRLEGGNPIPIKNTFSEQNREVNVIYSNDEISNSKYSLTNKQIMEGRNSGSSKQSNSFEEFLVEHSEHQNDKEVEPKLCNRIDDDGTVADFMEVQDLTQNTNSSEHSSSIPEVICTTHYDQNCLGKKDDVSIDYDEVTLNPMIENSGSIESKTESSETCTKISGTFINGDNIFPSCDEVYVNQTVENACYRYFINDNSVNENNKNIKLNDTASRIFETDIVKKNRTSEYIDDYIDLANDDATILTLSGEKLLLPMTNHPTSFASSEASQEVFEISDEELNYSLHKCKHLKSSSRESKEPDLRDHEQGDFYFGGISILDNISSVRDNVVGTETSQSSIHLYKAGESFLPYIQSKVSPTNKSESTTPPKDLHKLNYCSVQTPNNTEYLMKTNHVTPILDYAAMTTPDRNKELEKYGLKPFRRKRAIQLLNHLYTQTHPVVDSCPDENQPSPSKKRKPDHPAPCVPLLKPAEARIKKYVSKSPRKSIKSPRKCTKSPAPSQGNKDSGENVFENENNNYEETSSIGVFKNVECSPEDWVFQKREKAKVHSCRVPLHVAFHNYVSSRRRLREAILRYEPVNIDVIHKDLVGFGHRYDPKDLLRFLDKKCITVKTADNSGRNNKKS